jgi:hypothetical protein
MGMNLHTVSEGFRGKIRYALAEWGKIWGNPTLYFEHKLLDGKYQGIEPKLLLGDRIGKKGIWGVNLIYEAYTAPTRLKTNRGNTLIPHHMDK